MALDLKRKLGRLRGAGPGSRAPSSSPGSGQGHVEQPAASAGDALAEALAADRGRRVDRLRSMMNDVVARQHRRSATGHGDDARGPGSGRRDPLGGGADVPIPGEVRDLGHGEVHLVDRYLEPQHCHGRVPVAGALEVDPVVVSRLALDPALQDVDPRKMLLLDTETTGLSGGAGTIPFLIGMAWFEDESLRVQQLFLRRLGEEAPMLRTLTERIERASVLVTYNGKSFDWPLIRTRYVLNRVPMPTIPPHLDLLHCARRVYKRRLSAVRLVHMEQEVLGMHREGDVDGSLIPEIYLDFIRGRGGDRLVPVIEHNHHDLLALAAILARMTSHFSCLRREDDPRDHLSYAKVAERAKDANRALEFALAAADGGGDGELIADALLLSARLSRRSKDVVGEERALLRAATVVSAEAEESLHRAEVDLALAKLCEHRLKDLERALGHARRTWPAEDEAQRERRVERLERKLARERGEVAQ